jgi:hypothetical protein
MTAPNGTALALGSWTPKVIFWDLWGTLARSDNREPVLHLQKISIAIAIGDTFFGCIAIDYRDTFRQYR